ncbi:MAG: hypothetical protein ACTHNN_15240 [Xanthobacteraceae bacterium]
MDLAWTNSLDQLWRSPTFPMWLTLAAAAFFAIVFLVIVLRADRSVANGALTVMTLLAVAVAAAATVRGLGNEEAGAVAVRASSGGAGSLPALSCVDDLAGDSVEAACEKVLFGSPDHVAAAVSYAAARLDRLTVLGDATTATRAMTPELQALRRAVERDRYGLVAHVLVARDGCTAAICPAYRSLTDRRQVAANIEGRVYDGLVTRYTPTWSGVSAAAESGLAAPTSPAAAAALIGGQPSVPTGKPTDADFPSSASIPPVSIMTSEPPAASPAPSAAATPAPVPRPTAASHVNANAKANAKAAPKAAPKAASHPSTAAKRPANPAPPVQLAPPPSSGDR